jgi:hypothetical protein
VGEGRDEGIRPQKILPGGAGAYRAYATHPRFVIFFFIQIHKQKLFLSLPAGVMVG